MNKFNLIKEIIVADKNELQEAIKEKKPFAIDIRGAVKKEPFSQSDILIFKTEATSPSSIEALFSKEYQVLVDDNRVLIKAGGAWQDIINMNKERSTYDDTSSDGVDELGSKELEDIMWHANEFGITYRIAVEAIEKECSGTLICIERDEPYVFSGLGFLDNLDEAQTVLFDFCKSEIKRLMAEDDSFKKLSDDEAEAAEFFGALG